MASNRDFWAKQQKHSLVKTEIAVEYFSRWANILKGYGDSLTYLDLCSGRGRYKDGTPSTPLRILDAAIVDSTIRQQLSCFFYERNKACYAYLKRQVESHQAVALLKHTPKIENVNVGKEFVPSLPVEERSFTFIDPWGFKGISLDLLVSVVNRWGCDCLFYISIDGIRRNLSIPAQENELADIFLEEGLDELREFQPLGRNGMSFHAKVIEELRTALRKRFNQRLYFVPFAFEKGKRKAVSHYLIFLTKKWRGFEIMKDTMAKHSMRNTEGEPLYRWREQDVTSEIDFPESVSHVRERLMELFSGRRLTVKSIKEQYHIKGYFGTNRNITRGLVILRDENRIKASDPAGKRRRKDTIADDIVVHFPDRA